MTDPARKEDGCLKSISSLLLLPAKALAEWCLITGKHACGLITHHTLLSLDQTSQLHLLAASLDSMSQFPATVDWVCEGYSIHTGPIRVQDRHSHSDLHKMMRTCKAGQDCSTCKLDWRGGHGRVGGKI